MFLIANTIIKAELWSLEKILFPDFHKTLLFVIQVFVMGFTFILY